MKHNRNLTDLTHFSLVVPDDVEAQVKDIKHYNAQNYSETRAQKVLQSIIQGFAAIQQNPFAFVRHESPKTKQVHIRRMVVHKSYSIFYRIDGDTITILTVHHNTRNPARLDFTKMA